MQQSEKIAEYLEKAVPRMVSAKKYDNIRDELLSHILDKADFYIEIGYGKDEAYKKALDEMGEPEQVSTQFEEVYREKKIYAFIIFSVIILADIFAAVLGFGTSFISWSFDSVMFFSVESFVISSMFLCAVLLVIIYAHKEKHTAMVKAVGLAHIFMSVPLISGSIYFPFVLQILQFVFDEDIVNQYDVQMFAPQIITVPIAIIGLIASSKKRALKRKNKISEKASVPASVFIIIAILFLCCSAVLHTVISRKDFIENEYTLFNYSIVQEYVYSEKEADEIMSLYNSITKNTTYNEVDLVLRDSGFVPHTELDAVVTDKESLSSLYASIEDNLSDNLDCETVYLKQYESGYFSAYGYCFVISKTDDKPINYKKLCYHEQDVQFDIITFIKQVLLNIDYTQEAREVFESFCLDDSEDIVLKKIKRICTENSHKIEYTEKGMIETYTFSVSDMGGDLFNDETSDFHGTLVFRNNNLISGNYVYEHYEHYVGEEEKFSSIEYIIEK